MCERVRGECARVLPANRDDLKMNNAPEMEVKIIQEMRNAKKLRTVACGNDMVGDV